MSKHILGTFLGIYSTSRLTAVINITTLVRDAVILADRSNWTVLPTNQTPHPAESSLGSALADSSEATTMRACAPCYHGQVAVGRVRVGWGPVHGPCLPGLACRCTSQQLPAAWLRLPMSSRSPGFCQKSNSRQPFASRPASTTAGAGSPTASRRTLPFPCHAPSRSGGGSRSRSSAAAWSWTRSWESCSRSRCVFQRSTTSTPPGTEGT